MDWANRKYLQVFAVVLLILLILLAAFYFLKDHGAMGGLPDVKDLPQAKGTMVGKTVQTSFLSLSEEIDGVVPFYYLYDPTSGRDSLVVIQLPKILFPSMESVENENWYLAHSKVSLMTVLEPQWNGFPGLAESLNSKHFQSLVLHTAYISAEETGNLFHQTAPGSSSFYPEETIDLLVHPLPEASAPDIQIYFGQFSAAIPTDSHCDHWIPLENGGYVYLVGNMAAEDSPAFKDCVSSLQAVSDRYDLQQVLPEIAFD